MSLFAELKRRNVFRVAAAYAVVAWLVVQVGDIAADNLGFPGWFMQMLFVLLGLGFPVALLLSWAFELTPEGVKRSEDVPKDESVTPITGRRIDRLILIGALGVIALLVTERVWFAERDADPVPAAVRTVSAVEGQGAPAATTGKSIAVLPFADMSPAGDQEYFSDGIAEELLNALVKLPGLKVAGRTSSFAFRDRQTDLREIGRTLGVSHILEGSVRRAGDRVRITTQLIQTHDGFHVWSETYDRDLTDIFAVQEEITAAVVAALKVQLDTAAATDVAVADLDAYTLYLEARQKLALRGVDNLARARALFERAIARDPGYAPAHAGLGRALSLLVTYRQDAGTSQGPDSRELSQAAQAAARRALELDPANAEAWSVLGVCALWFDWDWAQAERALEHSVALRPNDAEIVNFLGDYYLRMLDPRAEGAERRAVELDPLHAVNHHDLALVHLIAGRYDAALEEAAAADALGFYAHAPEALITTTLSVQLKAGRLEDASATAARIEALGAPKPIVLSARLRVAEATGDRETADRLLRELTPLAEAGGLSPSWMAQHLVEAQRPREAASWLRRAVAARNYSVIAPRIFRLPEDLPDDPALRAVLDTPELTALFEIRRRNMKSDHEVRP